MQEFGLISGIETVIQGTEIGEVGVTKRCREGWRAEVMEPGGCHSGIDVWEETSWWESTDSPSRGKLE